MKKLDWSDKLQNRSRQPRLYVQVGETWTEFSGQPIPGKLAVVASRFEKNGKWSGTDWSLAVSDDAVVVGILCPFQGWGQTWTDLAQAVTFLSGDGDSVAVAQVLLRELPVLNGLGFQSEVARCVKTADENAAALAALK